MKQLIPNLTDYRKTYKNFSWQQIEKELLFFDKVKNKLNIAYNIDRHSESKEMKNKIALLIQDEWGKVKKFTYMQLQKQTNKFANLLKGKRLKKGDRVFLFLPKVAELYTAFVATLKLGCIAIPVFEAFGIEGLEERLLKADANAIITNSELKKRIKSNVKKKLEKFKFKIIDIDSIAFRKEIKKASEKFEIAKTNRNDAAFIIFTSSTAGTPVAGIMISHNAVLQQYATAKFVLDLKKDDRFFCTAHPGWITGSVYGIIAPFVAGCSNYVLGGRFDAEIFQNFISRNKISVIYTAPTVLRILQESQKSLKKEKWRSVRHICSVGEFLNPETFDFYKKKLGIEVHDTYWQTETGAIVIANFLCMKKKPGSMGLAVPGIKAKIHGGCIALEKGFPAMMKGIYKKQEMYKSYFKGNLFLTKDLAKMDKQRYFFFKARQDDIIKTAGERVSPIEIESVLLQHAAIKETAIVSKPDKIRGSIIVAFVVLKEKGKKKVKEEVDIEEIQKFVKTRLAGHAYPREIYFVKELPKTRSGKLMRKVLKAIIGKEPLGDISGLANLKCVEEIKKVIH